MYYWLKQGQITLNIEDKYALTPIQLVAQCSKITNTSVISKTYISYFFHFLLLSTSNARMSEGTFCRVEVHIYATLANFWKFAYFSTPLQNQTKKQKLCVANKRISIYRSGQFNCYCNM